MSASDTRMARPEAAEIAKRFVAEIEPYCWRLTVAGSLRRRLALIGDIEIVAVPKVGQDQIETLTLWGSEIEAIEVDRLDERMNHLLDDGAASKRLDVNWSPRWGPTVKYLEYAGARVDLFTPCIERVGWILMLRTGPAAFSRQLVLPKKDDRGRAMRTKDGRPGLLPTHIRPEGGWLTYRTSGQRIETPDEADVFELFGLPYQEPWERM